METDNLKFCKFCGEKIPNDAVICTKCGRQVEEIKQSEAQQIVINNNNNVVANATAINRGYGGRAKNKWISLALCVFTVCGHKFYEGKIGMGLIYLFTGGLFGIGWIVDIVILLFKPNPYFV